MAILKRKVYIVVELVLPEDATPEEAVNYVDEAVQTWAGSLFPGGPAQCECGEEPADPFFNLDRKRVKVRLLKSK